MSHSELVKKIEHQRSILNSLAACNADFSTVLKVSQELDELLVTFYKRELQQSRYRLCYCLQHNPS